jgi:hypothetical protein
MNSTLIQKNKIKNDFKFSLFFFDIFDTFKKLFLFSIYLKLYIIHLKKI